jgi:hypothetical protein
MLAEVAIAKNCKGGLNHCGFNLLAIGIVPRPSYALRLGQTN